MTNPDEQITNVIDVDDHVSVVQSPAAAAKPSLLLTNVVDVDDLASFVKSSPVVQETTAAEIAEPSQTPQDDADFPPVIMVDIHSTPDMTESTIPDITESTYDDDDDEAEKKLTEVPLGDDKVAVQEYLGDKFTMEPEMSESSESTDDVEQAMKIVIEFGEEDQEKEEEIATSTTIGGYSTWDYVLFVNNVVYLGMLAIIIYVPPIMYPNPEMDPKKQRQDYYPLDDAVVFITFFCICSLFLTLGSWIIMYHHWSQLDVCSNWMGWIPSFGMVVTVSLMIVAGRRLLTHVPRQCVNAMQLWYEWNNKDHGNHIRCYSRKLVRAVVVHADDIMLLFYS